MLDEVRSFAATCTACALHGGRINPVFDKGNSKAKIMICGMVPAYDENLAGIPFVGRAGKLLDIILKEVKLTYDDIYITNLVKCFLRAGKRLERDWIDSCHPFLIQQIQIIKPKVIITLGADASAEVTEIDAPIGKLRGKVFYRPDNIIVVPTYHPSYLLRKGGEKSPDYPKVIGDFELAKRAKNEDAMVR